ncbi:tyrosine-type recombinase/integrase [Thalassotalea atypica]|uniref:tyrosine-type recombinase/integrase n=1 Tax=Thalassotalea atypica TaxID=2054316 RepID=UPI002574266F|nr:tyrosine-type recombinase/integrase [Thalassotalea atypica]
MTYRTVELLISNKMIFENQKNKRIFQLKDSSQPFYYRYHSSRKSGTFYLVKRVQGKNRWVKLGSYPEISTTTARKALDIALERMMLTAQQGHFVEASFNANNTVADILCWYLNRCLANNNLSIHSRKGIRSVIESHLLERIGEVPVKRLSRSVLDQQLCWPLLQTHKPSTVKQVFQVLKRAFKTANGVGVIIENPLQSLTYKDFSSQQAKAKLARLTLVDLPKVFKQIINEKPMQQSLVLLMLFYGTRVGETSQARWSDFDKRHNQWRIPAEHTKTGQNLRLPITPLVWQLLKYHKQQLPLKYQRSPFLFPKKKDVQQAVTAQYASQKVSVLAGRKWSAHDLRKLARTAWLELGVDYVIGEFLLNHQLRQVDQAYIQTFANEKCLQAITLWHQYLLDHGLAEFECGRSVLDLKLNIAS